MDEPEMLRGVPAYEFFAPENGQAQESLDKAYFAVLNRLAVQMKLLLTTAGKGNPVGTSRQELMEVFFAARPETSEPFGSSGQS